MIGVQLAHLTNEGKVTITRENDGKYWVVCAGEVGSGSTIEAAIASWRRRRAMEK